MSETVREITERIRRHIDEPMTGWSVTAEDFASRDRTRSLCVPDAQLRLLLDALAARERELAEARAPSPPTRTVTRAQITEIARSLTSTLDITPSQHIGEVVVRYVARRLDLRVADDTTWATHGEHTEGSLWNAFEHGYAALAARLREAEQENVRLREALEFYADARRYEGRNQLAEPEERHKSGPFRKDVTRDGGQIARDALDGLR